MFDFLKDGKHTENKYKSTSIIPFLGGEDLTLDENMEDATHQGKRMADFKDEPYAPFCAIEEDWEMEDQMSCSDDLESEQNTNSLDSDPHDHSNGGGKIHLPSSIQFFLLKSFE